MDWDIPREKTSEIVDIMKKILSKDVNIDNPEKLTNNMDLIHIQSTLPSTELRQVDNTTKVQNKMDSITTSLPSDAPNNFLTSDIMVRNIPIYGESCKIVPKITSLPTDSRNKKVSSINDTTAYKELSTVTSSDIDTNRNIPIKNYEPNKNESQIALANKDSSIHKNHEKFNLIGTTTTSTTLGVERNLKSKNDTDTKSDRPIKNFQNETVENTQTTDSAIIIDKEAKLKEETELPSNVSADHRNKKITSKNFSRLVLITSILIIVATYLRLA